MFAPPRLRAPIVRVPLALGRVVSTLPAAEEDGGGVRRSVTSEDEYQAQALLNTWLAGRPAAPPGRRILRALVYRVYPQAAPPVRATIAERLAALPGVPLRLLWELWSNGESAVVPPLASALQRRLADPRRASRVPGWLGGDAANVEAALRAPSFALRAWCEGQRVALERLPAGLGLHVDRGPGQEGIGQLIAHGSDSWWALSSPAAARAWVDGRSEALLVAVADRLLRSHGGAAESAAQVRRDGESRALQVWLTQKLGPFEPQRAPWSRLGARALQVFEWLTMMTEFDRIIEEFRRDADPRRAAFWSRYTRGLRDARCYPTSRSAVCMLAFERVLVVEFGAVGNACYVYSLPSTWTPLWRRNLGVFTRPEEFKSRFELQIGTDRFPYMESMNHVGDWETSFELTLRNYRVAPERPASRSWRY